jgi:glycosyltransferase family protein
MSKEDELIARIHELEEENIENKKWRETVNMLLQQMLDMITKQSDTGKISKDELNRLWEYAMINRYRIDSLPFELMDPDYRSFFYKPKILSKAETIQQLSEKGRSIARLGDGEFAAIVGQKRWNFQDVSELLAQKLKEVLASNEDGLLIGLHPTFYMNLSDVPEEDADSVRAYMRPMVRRLHAELLDPEKIYGDAKFNNINTLDDVNNLKKIWNERECIFIEGCHTGMSVGNDLFDNCRSIGRILGPAENAINRYDEIMNEAVKLPKDKLILLALGPTATALAYDLYKEGYQAIDIGHVDLAYEAFIRKAPNMYSVNIPYKYCSMDERISGRNIEEIDDADYKSQIIAKIE